MAVGPDHGSLVRAVLESGALAGLDPRSVEKLTGDLSLVKLARDDELITAGDEASAVFIVLKGKLGVFLPVDDGSPDHGPPEAIAQVGPGALIGEMAVLAGGPRGTSVRALTKAEVVQLDADAFRRLLDSHAGLAAGIGAEATRRLRVTQLADAVTQHLHLSDADVIAWIEQNVDWTHLPAGDLLFRQGDRANSAYFVLSGRLRVTRNDGHGDTFLGEIGSGEMVGEVALIEGLPRNATVTAARDCDLAELPKNVFDTLIQEHPNVMLETMRTILHRARSPLARRATKDQLTVAIVAGDPDLDVRLFTSKLVDDLRALDETTHLWSARVDSMLGRPGIAQSEAHDPGHVSVSNWLQEIEHHSRFLVLEVDRTMTQWTKRALRSADLVLVAVSSTAGSSPTPLEAEIDGYLAGLSHRRRGLVILHGAGVERASHTARLLEHRRVDEHYHLRKGSTEDPRRLAAILGGTSIGLVLGGGGARGFAHLGAMRALAENGVRVDLVGGSSIGSTMGLGPALDLEIEETIELAKRQFKDLLDYTVPVVSMIKGERIVRVLEETLGDLDIEDLWRPYFCMSTNLTRSVSVEHRRGPLVHALRASVAIPGILPPVPFEGDLLVDGGVLNNLPVAEMRAMNPTGTVIAVDVAPKEGPRAKEDFGMSVSGTKELIKKLTPGASPKTPGIARTFLRSMLVGALRERDRHQADGSIDLYLDLDLRGIDLLAFDTVAEVAAAGYEASAPRVEAWLEANSAGTS